MITGASGDIAQALVRQLPDDLLFLLSRDPSALTKLYADRKNVTLLENDDLLPEAIDILINNAGFGVFAELDDLTETEIDAMFSANVIEPIKLVRKVKPKMQIVTIASLAAKLPTAKSSVYAATKAAILTFSDALRLETTVTVTTVNTGPVATKFHARNASYLQKVGSHALTADQVARKIVAVLGKKKTEINLPWTLALAAKVRALFPKLIDWLGKHFFNYK
jgi:short-subunit dehydrogenase